MNLDNVTVLCLRTRDINLSLLGRYSKPLSKIEVEETTCLTCGEEIASKNKIGLRPVKCLQCVHLDTDNE